MQATTAFESAKFSQQFSELGDASRATVNSFLETTAGLLANNDLEELQRLMALLGTIYAHIANGLEGPRHTLH